MSRMIKSFGFALTGLKYTFKTQPNFRFHCIAAAVAALAGYYFELDRSDWLWLLAASAMVLIAELLNTAIEVLVDHVSPEFHIKAGLVKDTAAAAVLVSAVIAAGIGLLIFVPKLI